MNIQTRKSRNFTSVLGGLSVSKIILDKMKEFNSDLPPRQRVIINLKHATEPYWNVLLESAKTDNLFISSILFLTDHWSRTIVLDTMRERNPSPKAIQQVHLKFCWFC